MKNPRTLSAALILLIAPSISAQVQERGKSAESRAPAALTEQIAELRQKIARLEMTLRGRRNGLMSSKRRSPKARSTPMGMGMNRGRAKSSAMGSGSGGMMGGMGTKMRMMGGGSGPKMSSGAPRSMGGMKGMGSKGMRMMGKMAKMSDSSARPASNLPGFPGVSHLYHIGATGFFLDHGDHIKLSAEQRRSLAKLQEKTTLAQATIERGIAQAEQDLWALTGSDAPQADKIQKTLRNIAELGVKQRMSFIRAVGQAARILSDKQRKLLLGDAMTDTPRSKIDVPKSKPSGVPSGK